MSKTTIREVAANANVSIATVSRVLNGMPVNKKNQEKVWKAIKELNYSPNKAARFMKGQKTGLIGIIVPSIVNSFYSSVISGAVEQAKKYNQVLVVTYSNGTSEKEKEAIDQLSRSMVDGLIYCPFALKGSLENFDFFKTIPTVIVNRRNILKGLPHVYSDNFKGGYISTKYLIKLGRKKISFIAGFWNPPCTVENMINYANSDKSGAYPTLDRFMGYLKALNEEGIDYDPSLVSICNYSYTDGYLATNTLLSKMVHFDAVFANDLIAAGAMEALSEQGINIPNEVSVIGYDAGLISEMAIPKLTSVKQDADEIGKTSVDIINEIFDNKPIKEEYIIDVELVIKKSTCKLNII